MMVMSEKKRVMSVAKGASSGQARRDEEEARDEA